MGCLPVTIGDKVLQPFEPQINWSHFSVPVAEKDIPSLHQILQSVEDDEARMAKMQRSIKCAAQHFVYSSITGGILGDDGKFDAFESILAVLRSITKNPSTPIEKLYDVDAEFRLFMNCGEMDTVLELEDDVKEDPEVKASDDSQQGLCSHSYIDATRKLRPDCYSCFVGQPNSHGVPGGAVCCGAKGDLSLCPRAWP